MIFIYYRVKVENDWSKKLFKFNELKLMNLVVKMFRIYLKGVIWEWEWILEIFRNSIF